MAQSTESNGIQSRNYLQFHEHAFVSPLNLINVTHPAPYSFGRIPHVLQQKIPRLDPSMSSASSSTPPHLQSIDANKLHMYQFLAQRKLKEDRWKKEMNEKNAVQQRNTNRTHKQPAKKPTPRSASAPKKPTRPKTSETNRSQLTPTPTPIHFTRPSEPYPTVPSSRQNEINDIHEQLLVQLRILHNPRAREHIIDETEQEKQRRIRLKRERIKRDSRAIYNAHQELKQILHEIHQPNANLARLTHRHLNAYKAILLAVETLANEAPIKAQDAPLQQLITALIPVLETLNTTNQALGLPQLHIDSSFFHIPPSSSVSKSAHSSEPSSHLLPSVYQELMKKKQQQQSQKKSRMIPSVLRPRSAESVRLPRTDTSTIRTRPTISAQHKTRARSHSPLPSIKSSSTIETPFYSRFTVDHILVKLAPRLLANYTGRELSEQIERARTITPMFLVENHLTDDDIVERVVQLLMPRQQYQQQQIPESTTRFETPEERARRIDIDVYQTQISTWEDEMSQIRQRLQNYRTNRLEEETTTRRTVKFQLDSLPSSSPQTKTTAIVLPEHVQIHKPLFESTIDDLVMKSVETQPAFVQSTIRGNIRLQTLDSNKIKQIERYRRDYQAYLQRTESARSEEFDPCRVINRLSEFLLDEALLSVVNEIELLTVELSQKLVSNELLGQEISLADVEKGQQHQYRRPTQQIDRKRSPISPPPNEQYNTSSFEEDFNSESRISRSDDEDNFPQRKMPMEGTGRFTTITTTSAFQQQKLPRQRSSSSSTISSPTHSPKGIIMKPAIVVTKPSSRYEEDKNDNQYSDRDFEESISSSSKGRKQPQQQQQIRRRLNINDDDDEEEDEELIISTKTGEKIYSTDFDESKSRLRNISHDDDDEDADTMRLSARSLNTARRGPFDSDDDDDDDDDD